MPHKKVRTLELARTGKHGLDGAEIVKQDIIEMVETFVGKRPVTIGHNVSDRVPKFGNVLECWSSADNNTLIGVVCFSEAADKLYESGAYDGWSISMPRRLTDGKRVLHHLAILGATPPKISNLEELEQITVDFSEGTMNDRYQFRGEIPKEDKDTMMTDEEKAALKEKETKIAELEAQNKALTEQANQKAAEQTAAQGATTPAADAKQDGATSDTSANGQNFADVRNELNELKAGRRQERLEVFAKNVAEKLPAGIAAKAKVLAGHIEANGAFDFSDNGKAEKRDALWLLGEILQGWPSPVKTGASNYNYGDKADNSDTVDWGAAARKM